MVAAYLAQLPDRASMGQALSSFGSAVSRRARLALDQPPDHASAPGLKLLLGEVGAFGEPVARAFRHPLTLELPERPRIVILLPGFATHPLRMRHMAEALEGIGHTVKRWGLGFNMGASQESFELLSRRLLEVRDRYGENVALVGWSLGGIFAREIAKKHPGMVDKVVTLGSPFSHTPYSNNAWRIYQTVTGHSVSRPPVEARLPEKPPVETVALWSPRDGVIAPRSACGWPGERDRAVALRCTHMGFSNSPEAIRAVARELAGR